VPIPPAPPPADPLELLTSPELLETLAEPELLVLLALLVVGSSPLHEQMDVNETNPTQAAKEACFIAPFHIVLVDPMQPNVISQIEQREALGVA